MKLTEWITKYEQKAEEFILLPGFSIYFEPDKGFFCWHVFGGILEIDHTCTDDIQHMNNAANSIAKEHHCRIMRTATYRDPAAYMRLQKARLNLSISGLRPNGKFYWIFERKVS